jgi:hypothetical protein
VDSLLGREAREVTDDRLPNDIGLPRGVTCATCGGNLGWTVVKSFSNKVPPEATDDGLPNDIGLPRGVTCATCGGKLGPPSATSMSSQDASESREAPRLDNLEPADNDLLGNDIGLPSGTTCAACTAGGGGSGWTPVGSLPDRASEVCEAREARRLEILDATDGGILANDTGLPRGVIFAGGGGSMTPETCDAVDAGLAASEIGLPSGTTVAICSTGRSGVDDVELPPGAADVTTLFPAPLPDDAAPLSKFSLLGGGGGGVLVPAGSALGNSLCGLDDEAVAEEARLA